jgi:hypothetical protein
VSRCVLLFFIPCFQSYSITKYKYAC